MSVAPIRTLKRSVGGAKITYYDGSTELGFEYVAEGQDVLHPSVTVPTKSNKTFIGWGTTTSESTWVGELTATGQPMNLYALYLDNTVTVISSNVIRVSGYTSGSIKVSVTATWNTQSQSRTFTLNKGRYETATAVLQGNFSAYTVGTAMPKGIFKFGGATIFEPIGSETTGSATRTLNNGPHTMYVEATAYGDYSQYGEGLIKSLVLSNPTAWT
jgi:hypothetical protein